MKYLRLLIVIFAGLLFQGLKPRRMAAGKRDGREAGMASSRGTSDESPPVVADTPLEVTKAGWKEAFKRTKQALKDKNLAMMAAGLAYYATLTFFPASFGLASLYAALAGPKALTSLLGNLDKVVPAAIQDLLERQLEPLARASQTSLGVATALSFAVVLWTTSGGVQNLIKATNAAYETEESRGLVKLRLVSLALSFVFIVFAAVVLVLLLLQGEALQALGMPSFVAGLLPIVRWPLLMVALSVVLSIIYRYAPDRRNPKWRWVSWGATAAVIIWLIGTVLFFFYAQNFGSFNKSYGTLASLIILMTWFNLSSLIILVGAQVNKKLEEVSAADTADRS